MTSPRTTWAEIVEADREWSSPREPRKRRTRLNDRHTLWLWLTGRWGR